MKTAIVTGASTGIGRVTSLAMAKAGYHVYLVARSKNKLLITLKSIEEASGSAEIVITDLNNLESINQLIKTIHEKNKEVNAIVNVAGVWHNNEKVFANTNFDNFNQETIIETYTVGLTAPTLIVHGLLPLMKQGSSIVNVSGTFENGAKGWLPYYTSKRALEDFTVGLAQELKDRNILVNGVSPSDTSTEEYAKHFPQYLNEAISPEFVAAKIVELCDAKRKATGNIYVLKKEKEPQVSFHH